MGWEILLTGLCAETAVPLFPRNSASKLQVNAGVLDLERKCHSYSKLIFTATFGRTHWFLSRAPARAGLLKKKKATYVIKMGKIHKALLQIKRGVYEAEKRSSLGFGSQLVK